MKWNILSYDSPKIMGILNVTPDSFYDGGAYNSENTIHERITGMLSEGADIIDIGAYSTRPGAENVSEQEEISRLHTALKIIAKHFPDVNVSIDTFRLSVVKSIYEEYGEFMVNDISGGCFDKEMFRYVGEKQLPYVCMHMQGTPQTMQIRPQYDDVVEDILQFFKEKIVVAKQCGISQFVVDPGFGFGKTVEQNYELMKQLQRFVDLQYPVLVGISRKSMIRAVLDCTVENALNGTTVLNTIALQKGAHILRVHDVKAAKEALSLVQKCY